MEKTLCDLKENEGARIKSVDGNSFAVIRRLLELGFLSGRAIRVLKKSFSKKTILVEIENYVLALRCKVADYVKVV